MTVTKRESGWFGSAASDIEEYLRAFREGGYPVVQIRVSRCGRCGRSDTGFAVAVDSVEGVSVRRCASCGTEHAMLDSAEFLDEADLESVECQCGHELFDVAVGYSERENGEIRWVSLGLRCRNDGLLGVCADWKIDYSPFRYLLDEA